MYAELMRKRLCSKCKVLCNETDFYASRETWCRKCKVAYVYRYQKKNKERTKRNKQNYVIKNLDKVRESKEKYRENNREKLRVKNSIYQKANNKKSLARCRNYQASKINATPKWITKKMKNDISEIYKKCKKGYHVDHIIPLRGKNVCGLHVPWNLQYLKAFENIKKGNKH